METDEVFEGNACISIDKDAIGQLISSDVWDEVSCAENKIIAVNNFVSEIDSYPREKIDEYRTLLNEKSYWDNRFDDLNIAFKTLTMYDLDFDYNELFLLVRQAAKNRLNLTEKIVNIRKIYPNIDYYNTAVDCLSYAECDKHPKNDPFNKKWEIREKRQIADYRKYSFSNNDLEVNAKMSFKSWK